MRRSLVMRSVSVQVFPLGSLAHRLHLCRIGGNNNEISQQTKHHPFIFRQETPPVIRDPASKIMTYEQAIAFRQQLHDRGGKLVVTNGCFDVLHRGHVEYLSKSRLEGDALLVAVNGDASLRAVKGPTRPIVCEGDRAYLIASLECVDAVVVFPNQKPLDLFEQVPTRC